MFGIDVKTFQENLGYHTTNFTLDVYGHVTGRMAKDLTTVWRTISKASKTCKGYLTIYEHKNNPATIEIAGLFVGARGGIRIRRPPKNLDKWS